MIYHNNSASRGKKYGISLYLIKIYTRAYNYIKNKIFVYYYTSYYTR